MEARSHSISGGKEDSKVHRGQGGEGGKCRGCRPGSCPPRPIYRLSRAYSRRPPLSSPKCPPPPSQRFIGKTCSGDISSPPLEGSVPPPAASPWLHVYWISSKTAWKPRSLAFQLKSPGSLAGILEQCGSQQGLLQAVAIPATLSAEDTALSGPWHADRITHDRGDSASKQFSLLGGSGLWRAWPPEYRGGGRGWGRVT